MIRMKVLSKRIIAVLLSLSVLCSVLLLQSFSVIADETPWNGTVSSGLAGSGTSGDPYLISNGSDLAYLAKFANEGEYNATANKYYKLTADVYLNDVSDPEWYKGENLNGWYFKAFLGTLDGAGHSIHGIYITDEIAAQNNRTKVGFIDELFNPGLIKNLAIEDSYISVSANNSIAGAFVGVGSVWSCPLRIENCFSTDTVRVSAYKAGGIIGQAYRIFNITNCYSSAVVEGNQKGAIAGGGVYDYYEGTPSINLTECYSTTSGLQLVGEWYNRQKYTSCYATKATTAEGGYSVKELTAAQMTGAAAAENMTEFHFPQLWYVRDNDSPIPTTFIERGPDTAAPVLSGEVVAAGISADTAAVNWNQATDLYTLSEKIVYSVYKSSSPITNVSGAGVEKIATVTGDANFIAAGLVENSEYYFAVTAKDEAGNVSPLIASAKYVHSFSDTDNWDGSAATRFAAGNGSESNPYLISTAEQLAYLMNLCSTKGTEATKNKHFALIANINLNDVTNANWKDNGAYEWFYGTSEDTSAAFAGTFDGRGHVIKGIYINETAKLYNGLFSALSLNATVKNLGIADSYICGNAKAGNYTGALAGLRTDSTSGNGVKIQSCYVDKDVTVEGDCASGLISKVQQKLSIENCYSKASVTGTADSALFVAEAISTTVSIDIKYCYSSVAGVPLVTAKAASKITYSDSYSVYSSLPGLAKLTLEQMTGEAAKQNMRSLDFSNTWKVKENDTPILVAFSPIVSDIEVWDGTVAAGFAGGTGKVDDPWIISNAAELAYLASKSTGWNTYNGKYFKLTNDIYLNDVSDPNWYSGTNLNSWMLKIFTGTLDGDGHVIHGIYITEATSAADGRTTKWAGFADEMNINSSFKNLGIEDSYIAASTTDSNVKVGAFAGRTVDWTAVKGLENCYVSDTVRLTGYTVGGLTGFAYAPSKIKITNCYSAAVLTGTKKGGLIGDAPYEATNNTLENCYSSTADVQLVGGNFPNRPKYINCYATKGTNGGQGNVTTLTVAQMTGSAAKANMPGFNFADKDNINAETKPTWYLSPGNTPKLYKFCRTELDLTEPVFETGTITRRIASQVAIAIEWPKAVDVQYTPSEFINYTVYWSKDIITSANVGSANVGGNFVGVTGATISGFSLGDEIYFAVAATDQGGNTSYVFADAPLKTEATKSGLIWNGGVAEMYDAGTGTQADPYIIASAEQLALLVKSAKEIGYNATYNKYYKLSADIILNDVSKEDWKDKAPKEWIYGASENQTGFCGKLDGDGHVVKGIYISDSMATCGGLFCTVQASAEIRNLGVVESEISATEWAGALVGLQIPWTSGNGVIVENCFSDETVIIESSVYAGGLFGGVMLGSGATSLKCHFTNCYSGAQINAPKLNVCGSIVGETRFMDENDEFVLENCFGMHPGFHLVGNNPAKPTYINCYTLGVAQEGITKLNYLDAFGENVKNVMTAFNFETVWATSEDGSPYLRKFGEHPEYAANKTPVTISFVTNCDIDLEPVVGYVGDKLELPTLARDEYTFDGWYVYKELDIKYPIDTFPAYSMNLFAKWIDSATFRQDFEDYAFSYAGEDGLGKDHELYRPGVSGYDSEYVYGGGRSIHRIGELDEASEFQIFNADSTPLETGKNYRLRAMVYVDKASSGNIQLVSSDRVKLSKKTTVVANVVDVTKISKGEWLEVTVDFTARGKYLLIRTPGLTDMYFDDISIFKLSDGAEIPAPDVSDNQTTGTVTDADTSPDDGSEDWEDGDWDDEISEETGESNAIVICLIVFAVSALAVVSIILFKRKKSLKEND